MFYQSKFYLKIELAITNWENFCFYQKWLFLTKISKRCNFSRIFFEYIVQYLSFNPNNCRFYYDLF